MLCLQPADSRTERVRRSFQCRLCRVSAALRRRRVGIGNPMPMLKRSLDRLLVPLCVCVCVYSLMVALPIFLLCRLLV